MAELNMKELTAKAETGEGCSLTAIGELTNYADRIASLKQIQSINEQASTEHPTLPPLAVIELTTKGVNVAMLVFGDTKSNELPDPIMAVSKDGSWNCNNFAADRKTVIKNDGKTIAN